MTAMEVAKSATAGGNVVGFASNGNAVVIQRRRDGSWWCYEAGIDLNALPKPGTFQTWKTKGEAANDAAGRIDDAATEERKWW